MLKKGAGLAGMIPVLPHRAHSMEERNGEWLMVNGGWGGEQRLRPDRPIINHSPSTISH
jgi:hypothetical protein